MNETDFKKAAMTIIDKAEFINSNSSKMEVNVSLGLIKSFRQENIFNLIIKINNDQRYLSHKWCCKEEIDDIINKLNECIRKISKENKKNQNKVNKSVDL